MKNICVFNADTNLILGVFCICEKSPGIAFFTIHKDEISYWITDLSKIISKCDW